jgi:trk system potassium uptake protein TrkA
VNIVILGCGRVGALAATRLSESHDLTVIDWNPSSFDRLPSEYAGDTLLCNGIDVDCLREAGVEGADAFLALTDNDNRNLMAAQIAMRLGAGRSIARVYDAQRGVIFSEMGLSIVSPTVSGAQRLFELVLRDEEET